MRTPFFDIDFDPNEQYPVYQGYSPKEAGMVGKELSDRGINPIFTDAPTQTADSGQIYTDLKPPTSYEPTDEAMKFAQEQAKFAKYFDEELDKSGNFGSSMYRTPQQEEMKKMVFNEGLRNFSEWYRSKQKEYNLQKLGATESGNMVSFDPRKNMRLINIGGENLPYNEKEHGRLISDTDKVPPVNNTLIEQGKNKEAALEGLSGGQQEVVKKLTNYEIPLPSGFALKSPYWQGILERASVYDPTFDATQYNAKVALKNDFAKGKAAINIRSLNTAIGHLDTLSKKAEALKNSDIQLWNKIANIGLSQIGDKRVVEFNNAATAVESELAAVFKGMGATDQEIKQWRKNLSDAQSPEQLKGSIDTAIELLGSRMEALQNQYEVGMGKPKDFKFLSPQSEKILKNLGVDTGVLDSTSTQESKYPPRDKYFMDMRKANPNATTEEINAYLDKKGIR